jgi:nicotinate-nucleotide adenylyltransferase
MRPCRCGSVEAVLHTGARRRIGVFGGTFDPVHVGHLVAAVNVRHELGLDEVLLVVANVPWQKAGARSMTPAEDRFAMVAAATAGVPGLVASRLELDRGGPSYTADTLAEVAAIDAGAELYCVVGADLVPELGSWERAGEVRAAAILAVVNRPGASLPASLPGWRVREVPVPALDISSTDLRQRVADGRPLDFLVPEPAVRCIRDRGLYAGSR